MERLIATQERMARAQEKFESETRDHFQEVDKYITRLNLSVGKEESQGKLPSQTELNPRENLSAITFRSGTTIESRTMEENARDSENKEVNLI